MRNRLIISGLVLFCEESCVHGIMVTSLAVLFDVLISPPPETVAVFVTLNGAGLATLTDNVMDG